MRNVIYTFLLGFFMSSAVAQTTLDTAVDFNVKDIYGATYNLFELLDSNKYVLLDFFTTNCGPCVTYAPDIQQAYMHFGSNQGNVFFLGLAWDPSNASVHAFDSIYGITFPTVSGQGNSYNVMNLYNTQGFPTSVLVAPNRLILVKQIWPPSFAMLDSTISSHLGITTAINSYGTVKEYFRARPVFPNPAGPNVRLNFELQTAMEISVDIISLLGNKVMSFEPQWYEKGRQQKMIDVSSLKDGMYFAKFYSGDTAIGSQKFMKK